MNKSKTIKIMSLVFVLLFVLLILLMILIQITKTDTPKIEAYIDDKSTIEGVIKSNKSEFINQKDEEIYISSAKDLYNNDGTDNELYFEKMINELIPFFKNRDFTIIDEKKDFKIFVKYEYSSNEYKIYYNEVADFYSVTNGEAYAAIDNTEIVDAQKVYFKDHLIDLLIMDSTYFTAMSKELTDGVAADNKYTDYMNGTVSVRLAPNKVVKNLIFRDGYSDKEIATNITMNSTLEEVHNLLPKNAFGGINKGFLGYRAEDFYIFFYDDEISIYPYAYRENTSFEKLLLEYVEDKDLGKFARKLTTAWKNYDYYKFDEESQNLYLLYASRGIEINIKENDLKGIVLYTNYYFTDDTKKLVKNGYVTLNSESDLIDTIEGKRRDNTLNFD